MKHARGQNKLFQNASLLMCFCNFATGYFLTLKAQSVKPQSHIHGFGPGRATVHPELVGKVGVNWDEWGWKRRKIQHQYSVTRCSYGSTTTHAGSPTIHPDGATNAQECSRCGHDSIRCYYGLSR